MGIPWPAGVNQDVLRSGYSEAPEDNAYRFKPDVGPPIGLSRTIMNTEMREWDQWFPRAQYDALKTWRRVDLRNGVLAFDRVDPFLGDMGTFVFDEGVSFKLVEALPMECRISFKLIRIA